MVLKFHKLEYHGKLDFATLEYPKSGWFLHIFETVVDCNIILKNVLFGYFCQIISVNKELTERALLGFFSIERRERNMEDGCYLLCFSQSTYLSLSLSVFLIELSLDFYRYQTIIAILSFGKIFILNPIFLGGKKSRSKLYKIINYTSTFFNIIN